MKNLSLKNIANAVNGKLFCNKELENKEIAGAVIDSRLVEKDYLFIAVAGNRVDGHDFIDAVFEKGALAVFSEKELNIDKPYILVESSLEALKALATFYRDNLDIKIVGITGSVGKTSTKEFVASVLSEKYDVYKTKGNFNNEIGLPLTILGIRDNHEIAVIEMGISDFGEMTRLAKIAKPDICIITNIGICHLENLGTRDGILKAKTEMFEYAKDDCQVILNGDDDKLITIKEVKGKKTYFTGMNEEFLCHAFDVESEGIEGTRCKIKINDDVIEAFIHIPGIHMVRNAMVAGMAGNLLGLSSSEIKNGIEKMIDAAGRVNIIKKEYTIIDDCYNANPVSMKASIDLLKEAKGVKVAVVGDMYELGEKEHEYHEEVGKYIADSGIDYVFACGTFRNDYYKGLESSGKISSDRINIFDNIDDLIYNIKKFVEADYTILVKASHSMHFEKVIESLK